MTTGFFSGREIEGIGIAPGIRYEHIDPNGVHVVDQAVLVSRDMRRCIVLVKTVFDDGPYPVVVNIPEDEYKVLPEFEEAMKNVQEVHVDEV